MARGARKPHDDVREVGGRLYFAGIGGKTPAEAMDNLAKRAKAVGIDLGHFAFVNAYCANGVTLGQLISCLASAMRSTDMAIA